jgi:hypothetical protein
LARCDVTTNQFAICSGDEAFKGLA